MPHVPCRCGSGHDRSPLYDAAGIFLCYVCDVCEDATRKKYNPKVFNPRSAYAVTGEEEDLY